MTLVLREIKILIKLPLVNVTTSPVHMHRSEEESIVETVIVENLVNLSFHPDLHCPEESPMNSFCYKCVEND